MKSRVLEFKRNIRSKALSALSKPPMYGPDVDISPYIKGPGDEEPVEIDIKSPSVRERLINVGIDPSGTSRGGSYYQVDNLILQYFSKIKGVEILSLEEALEKHADWILDYIWRLVNVDSDKFTALAELYGEGGYVIIVKDNVKVEVPIQTCLLMHKNMSLQAPHNIIIVGDNAELHVITGCTIMREAPGIHAGVTEIYVGRNSKVTYTMIHGWSLLQHVRPRTGIMVEEGGEYISHYITMAPSKTLQTDPKVYLEGENAKAHLSSVVIGVKEAVIDVGGAIFLNGKQTSGEIVSRALAKDNAKVTSRAFILGGNVGSKGHVECMGLLLSSTASIKTVPMLEAKVDDVELTHEASIGKIAEEKILYLMARGFSRDEATSMIVRGFMSVSITGIPEKLKKAIEHTIDIISKGL